MSNREIERTAFSLRFREALRNAGLPDTKPTILSRSLYLRDIVVTVHAARKWLLGEAIPTQDKLTAIAAWLGVKPEWLRYGAGDAAAVAPAPEPLASSTLRMLDGFGRLPERDQMIVHAMVDAMLKTASKAGAEDAGLAAAVRAATEQPPLSTK